MNQHIGSDFNDFLDQEGIREEVVAAAMKRVIAWQLAEAMKARGISKTQMAARMHTSRMVVNRLLDASDTSVTLATLARASVAVGIPMHFELGDGNRKKGAGNKPAGSGF
ncbi:helix-turn-helix domain-containing protein [Alloalcanivorax mobilis]|uniref:helix-turn-helix domain-containing protein n=1 Tax=Alloalcanivorax mobilis TaxID=2019569 RepID=UPI000B5B3E8E|nr:helix-turn-helix transcriptional regulator [Alloalcanivorax mobilis]ASK34721.1 Fis family transcriptional regulator [Alcanivorax sp. N3-2A]|tara:strand:- start:1963 stop:2292 length:330 start_codon:yes stop_codon:yes gene_type:complete